MRKKRRNKKFGERERQGRKEREKKGKRGRKNEME